MLQCNIALTVMMIRIEEKEAYAHDHVCAQGVADRDATPTACKALLEDTGCIVQFENHLRFFRMAKLG